MAGCKVKSGFGSGFGKSYWIFSGFRSEVIVYSRHHVKKFSSGRKEGLVGIVGWEDEGRVGSVLFSTYLVYEKWCAHMAVSGYLYRMTPMEHHQ